VPHPYRRVYLASNRSKRCKSRQPRRKGSRHSMLLDSTPVLLALHSVPNYRSAPHSTDRMGIPAVTHWHTEAGPIWLGRTGPSM
jgi:hypothetical protein